MKIGIITFHHPYNCGSMMQAFALQTIIENMGFDVEIINFSNAGQKKLYKLWFPNNKIKNLIKNIIIAPHRKHIENNNDAYEKFMKRVMHLTTCSYENMNELNDEEYSIIVAGSDQIWNITIDDSDDAYFLPWAKRAKKVAYAPSFGARNILDYSDKSDVYAEYLNDFSALSIRENNGKAWIKDLTGKKVPVVLDPTLLLDCDVYSKLIIQDDSLMFPSKYIFYYSPHYDNDINRLVSKISKKLQMPVVAFNAKQYYVKLMNLHGFLLPQKEDPSIYLSLIKNAQLIVTTSFHGSVFSSIFRKNFWIVKNGEMFGTDDRVISMTDRLDLSDRLIPISFDEKFDYALPKDYTKYEILLNKYRAESIQYLSRALEMK